MIYRIVKRMNAAAWSFVMLALAGTAFDCMNKPLDPVAPTWETRMTAPVSVRSYTLADMIAKDSSLIGVAPGGTQLVYATTFQADPTFVGNLISLSPLSRSAQVRLGAFSIGGSSYAFDVQFPAGFPKGTTSPVPPATISFSPLQGTLPGIDSVSFQSGTVELHLKNNLPVPVTVQNPITLTDASGTSWGSFDFTGQGPIQPGKESIAVLDLAGIFLTRTVGLSGLKLSEPGSAQPLPIPPDSLVVAVLVARNPVVRSAIVTTLPAQTPAQNVTQSLPLTDSTLVKDLAVHSGTITIHFQSMIPVNASFGYTIRQVLTSGGSVYADNIILPARGTFDRTIDLRGFRLLSPDGGFIASLDVTGSISISPVGGGGPVKIQESDNIAFTLTTSQIVADSVVGVMKPTWVAVNAILPVKLGDLTKKFHGQVNIPAANLRLIPQSSIMFPLQLDLKLQAESNRGALLSEMAVPETRMTGAMKPIDFVPGDVGRFLSTISGQLPDSLRVGGAVLLNPDYDQSSTQSVGSRSWFGGQMLVSFPLTFSLAGGLLSDTASIGDTTGSGQGHTLVDQKTAADFNRILVHVGIDNAIPLQVALKLHLLDRAHGLLISLPQTAGDSITIPAPALNGGTVQSPTHTERVLSLAGPEVRQFNNAYSLAYELVISTPSASIVQFESTQAITIRVWAEFSYQVNK